jgi:competence protein CoiA
LEGAVSDEAIIAATTQVVYASEISESDWSAVKQRHVVGQFKAACCNAAMVPKTSLGGLRFFAHASGECGNAPESVWHEETKASVFDAFASVASLASVESPGRGAVGRWIADVHVRVGNRQIAIEIQHSQQTLAEYLRRQRRYRDGGWECYWLLYRPRFFTLAKAVATRVIKERYGGRWPDPSPKGFGLPELPFALIENQGSQIVMGPDLSIDLLPWAQAIKDQRYRYEEGRWIVADV